MCTHYHLLLEILLLHHTIVFSFSILALPSFAVASHICVSTWAALYWVHVVLGPYILLFISSSLAVLEFHVIYVCSWRFTSTVLLGGLVALLTVVLHWVIMLSPLLAYLACCLEYIYMYCIAVMMDSCISPMLTSSLMLLCDSPTLYYLRPALVSNCCFILGKHYSLFVLVSWF